MKLIATHDSATGEKGKGILSWLGTPFARTQSKTIKEQYEVGCRMFDLRVKLTNKNEWRCAHGIWVTERIAEDIIRELNSFEDKCYVSFTYEGNKDNVYEFTKFINDMQEKYTHFVWGGIAVKYGEGSHLFKVKYDYLKGYPAGWPASKQGFLPLDGRSWHIILPIPWLWKKLYNNNPVFNEKYYTFVDFL